LRPAWEEILSHRRDARLLAARPARRGLILHA
jgi:hypothetical protein